MLYVPKIFKGRIGYEIFVDRFYRGNQQKPKPIEGRILKDWNDSVPNWWPNSKGEYTNDYFYGGDLKGITEKLPFLKQVLGVDLLYISPISKTPSNHHYDVEDQRVIDPWIGNMEDYVEMCERAHELGMLVTQDLVFNHMGAYSKIFKEACKDKSSHYRNWFEWDADGNPVYWFGIKEMPQCNKLNEEYQKYVIDVIKTYMNAGADGFRLDLGEILPKDLMYKIMSMAQSLNPDVLIVSEMWDLATENGNRQIFDGQAHSVMNYPMGDAICRWLRYGNSAHLLYTANEIAKYPKEVQDVLWNFLDSHDNPRLTNLLAGEGMQQDPFKGRLWRMEDRFMLPNGQCDTYAFRKFEADRETTLNPIVAFELSKIASLMQYAIKGVPIIYYGAEAGMTGYKDPFNRKPYPWENENQYMIEHYSKLSSFRNKFNRILLDGIMEIQADSECVCITRRKENMKLDVIINREKTIRDCKLAFSEEVTFG